MSSRNHRSSHRAALQAFEMAWAVPQVMAHRLARLSLAAPVPSSRDRKEFQLMGSEKGMAFAESWSAVAVEMQRAWLGLWMSPAFWAMPWGATPRRTGAIASRSRSAALAMLAGATAPVHRRVVANARRLGRVPLR